MLATVSIVVQTHNLASWRVCCGAISGHVPSRHKTGALNGSEEPNSRKNKPTNRTYKVIGQVFFASSDQFNGLFDLKEAVKK